MRRIMMAVLSLAFVFTMSAASAPTARGYSYFYGGTNPIEWYVGNIRWCINEWGSWGSNGNFIPTINEAFENFDEVMSARTVSRYTGGPNCEVEIHVVSFRNKNWTGIARTYMVPTSNNANIYDSDIYFNGDLTNDFWFSTNHHVCTVVCSSDRYDLFTIASHEFGHALGLGENSSANYCTAGYDTEQAALACTNDFLSLDIMYVNAGDGYRRWITNDTEGGLVNLGYG
jgi:hypothetical protein